MMSEFWQLKETWVCKQNHTEHSSGKITKRKHLCKHYATMSLWERHECSPKRSVLVPSNSLPLYRHSFEYLQGQINNRFYLAAPDRTTFQHMPLKGK